MKKISLLLMLICVLFLCACNKEESTLTTGRVQQTYEYQTTPTAVTQQVVTTQLNVGNTLSSQIFFTNTNIWSDFDDVQRYDNTAINTTIEKKDVAVFNYPLQTVLAYFSEIAFADEGEGALSVSRKWIKPIYYEIYGTPDEVDAAVIRWAADYLNSINGFPGMFSATQTNKANVKFYFGNTTFIQSALGVTDSTMQSCTRLFYNADDYRIQLAKVGIANDTTSRSVRTSLILEEILQMVGLNQNSLNYPQSLFYKANAIPQVPDELDLAVVKLLYSPVIKSGMNKADGVTAAADVLVSHYESGVVYTEPQVDFAMLALEYAITTVTDTPTEEPTETPTEEPTTKDSDDPTYDDNEDDPTEATEKPTDEPPSEPPTGPTIIIPTKPPEPSDSPTDPIVTLPTNPPATDPPETERPSADQDGPTVPSIDIS